MYTGVVFLPNSNTIGVTILPCMSPNMRGEIEIHPHSRECFGEIHQFFDTFFRQNTFRSCFWRWAGGNGHLASPKRHLPSLRKGLTPIPLAFLVYVRWFRLILPLVCKNKLFYYKQAVSTKCVIFWRLHYIETKNREHIVDIGGILALYTSPETPVYRAL